jgi:hypothetical protein
MPETIDEEYAKVEKEAARSTGHPDRDEYVRGVLAALDWSLNGSGLPL